MDENEDKTMEDELRSHICELIVRLEELDPTTEDYIAVRESIIALSNIIIRIEETQMKYEDEVEKRHFEYEMEQLRNKFAKELKEVENSLKRIDQREAHLWHTVESILRAASIGASVCGTIGFTYIALVQTRANYVDNIYDASPAAKMVMNKIGKDLTIKNF